MTAINLILVTIALALAAFIGYAAHLAFRVDAWLSGEIFLAVTAIGLILATAHRRRHLFPTCQKGQCGTSDYKVLGRAGTYNLSKSGLVLECRCGDRYLFSGAQFCIVSDSTIIPYMERGFLSGWRPHKQSP